MSLHPSVAAVRRPVRASLAELAASDSGAGASVVVACSGGADSLALLSATIFEGHKLGLRVIGATVDHGLQEGSDAHASDVVTQMAAIGADETASARVAVEPAGLGVEAAARQARYAVLEQMRDHFGAAAVLLGHTRDDQAETVLLGLTRGSGPRSLAGMRRAFDRYRRPLLDVPRADIETACHVEGIEFWTDPHNSDFSYTRARIRHRVLPLLEEDLGPGVAAALARTAEQAREDADLLDDIADQAYAALCGTDGLPVDELAKHPAAIRRRVVRLAALAAGAPPAELFREHVLALDALVTDWHGQRWIDLPGRLRGVRRDGLIHLEAAPSIPGS